MVYNWDSCRSGGRFRSNSRMFFCSDSFRAKVANTFMAVIMAPWTSMSCPLADHGLECEGDLFPYLRELVHAFRRFGEMGGVIIEVLHDLHVGELFRLHQIHEVVEHPLELLLGAEIMVCSHFR